MTTAHRSSITGEFVTKAYAELHPSTTVEKEVEFEPLQETHMTGPEHHREAERLLALVTNGAPAVQHAAVVAEAQVHALLALSDAVRAR